MQFKPPSQPGWGDPDSNQQPIPQPPYQQPQFYQTLTPPSQSPPPQIPVPPTQYRPPSSQLPPSQSPKKKSRRNLYIGIVIAVIVFAIIGANVGHNPSQTGSSSQANQNTNAADNAAASATASDNLTATANANFEATASSQITSTPVPTQKPAPTFITFGDGTYQVGSDIKPGTYRTQTGSTGCYYERLKGFSGTDSDILANNLTDFPAIVTILPTDKGFTSQNCGTWTSDLSQITTSKTTFSDGMYIVGTDIAPGSYKNTPSQGCYYAQLSGFDNTDNAIIANNLIDSAAIVTISASDKGFESHGCGTWTRI